jgi:predicted metal-dependent hydrolase
MLTQAEWESRLARELDRQVAVTFGRARTQPVRATFDNGRVEIRLHEFFAKAPGEVIQDLAAWLRSGRRARNACRRLDRWIDEQLAALPRDAHRRIAVRTRGSVHDLDPMADSLLANEFVGDFSSHARPVWTWGKRGRTQARRSLQLGCYVREAHLVRIHTVLDQRAVPAWFVRFVLFHEMLHAALPGEKRPHGPAFCERERAHPDYPAAVAWQKRHLDLLIRSARRGEPMRTRGAFQGLLFPLR